MGIKITYAITCWNEINELTKLLNFLQQKIRPDDEILIQYDSDKVTPDVLEYLNIMSAMHTNHVVIGFPLKRDFASFKNNLKKHCTGDYIFNIDADEIPHQNLIEYLPDILISNPVDLMFVPRINTVDGITLDHVHKWGWNISKLDSQIGYTEMDKDSGEYQLLKQYDLIINDTHQKVEFYKPIINAFEYQTRIYKVTDDINWERPVHEIINGYTTFSNFPAEERWSLYHPKGIQRQEDQNKMYSTI